MKINLPFDRRGHSATAATSALAAAVCALSLAGCGDQNVAQGAASDEAPIASAAPASLPSVLPRAGASDDSTVAPEADTNAEAELEVARDDSVALSDLGPQDDAPTINFPGAEAIFSDGSSASSDGMTLNVTTAAKKSFSFELPTNSGGFFYGTTVSLEDAGMGYMITQTGGEYLYTFLVVLKDGNLYLPKFDDEVTFGQFAGEGPFFETYTTNDGDHLVTKVENSGRSGDDTAYYEWAVEDGRLVPTQLS